MNNTETKCRRLGRKLMSLLLTLVMMLTMLSAIDSTAYAAGTIVYVNASVVGGKGDGSSWANAFASLQDAIDAANASGGLIKEIRVAGGTYKPSKIPDGAFFINTSLQPTGTPVTDRAMMFIMPKDVSVRGGYAPNGSGARDVTAYETILSGNIGDENDVSDNCYYVVLFRDSGELDGFTVTGGHRRIGTGDYDNEFIRLPDGLIILRGGAGIQINHPSTVSDSNVIINNCTIEKNYVYEGDGAGITITNSYPSGNFQGNSTITNCLIRENSHDEYLGGIGPAVTYRK